MDDQSLKVRHSYNERGPVPLAKITNGDCLGLGIYRVSRVLSVMGIQVNRTSGSGCERSSDGAPSQ